MRIQYIKVDYSVQKFSIEFSCVTPNTRLPHNPTLRVLSYNIRTRFQFLGLLNIKPSLLSLSNLSSTKGQHHPLVQKNSQALGLRGTLVRQRKPSCLLASKPTVAHQTYYLVWMWLLFLHLLALYYKSTCGLSIQRNSSCS